MPLPHRSARAFWHRHLDLIRRWVFCALAGALLALLLLLAPWSLPAALAIGGGMAAGLALAWHLGLRWQDRPAEALVLLTERMRAAGAGDFHSPVTRPLAQLAPEAAATADWAVERLQGMVERANSLAFNDPVTNLPNRLHVRREGEARLAALPDGQSAALMFIDLDRFKAVNDSLGHAHGDMLLMRIGGRLAEQVEFHSVRQPGRLPPVLGRLAGDEFTVLLPGADRAEALLFAQMALASIRRPIDVHGRTVHVDASFGIAMAPDHGVTFSRLMRAADDAMYAAKRTGRGRATLFEDHMAATRLRAERMEAELRGALIGDELSLAYQPQVQLATGRADVVEALVRWGPGRPRSGAGRRLPGGGGEQRPDRPHRPLGGDRDCGAAGRVAARRLGRAAGRQPLRARAGPARRAGPSGAERRARRRATGRAWRWRWGRPPSAALTAACWTRSPRCARRA